MGLVPLGISDAPVNLDTFPQTASPFPTDQYNHFLYSPLVPSFVSLLQCAFLRGPHALDASSIPCFPTIRLIIEEQAIARQPR